jgi:hypothetical protein
MIAVWATRDHAVSSPEPSSRRATASGYAYPEGVHDFAAGRHDSARAGAGFHAKA